MQKETQETYLYEPASKLNDALDVYFCFPGPYYTGMSSLGFLSIFKMLDKKEFIDPHRIFSDTVNSNIKQIALLVFHFLLSLIF